MCARFTQLFTYAELHAYWQALMMVNASDLEGPSISFVSAVSESDR